ncbi:Uncharacterised protein [Salmonella enterica subsp. enterica]|uniref:Uncharacterized protein n=1 Tax=Salmonella enterica I TaxID=59201 RepID=A0A3S4IDM5_SALET|nr:Uncharacterised protein [Salmonella enterica subsp. enterica]
MAYARDGSREGRGKWSTNVPLPELIRHQVVTRQQRFKAVIMAFGLQNFIFFDTTPNWLITPSAGITRMFRIGIERTHVITQRTNKEIIERTIAGGIGFLRLGHIDFVILLRRDR